MVQLGSDKELLTVLNSRDILVIEKALGSIATTANPQAQFTAYETIQEVLENVQRYRGNELYCT